MKRDDLIKLRLDHVARGVNQFIPAVIAEAKGVVVRDVEGKEFLDFSGGIGVLNVGHCPDEVVEAIRDQAGKYLHTCFMVQMYEPYIALAKELNELISSKSPMKTMFVNSGAEAVENAGIGGTFGGNPVCCRAGLAVLKILKEKKLVERSNVIGEKVTKKFRSFMKKYPFVGDVRGLGAMNAMEIVVDKKNPRPNGDLAKAIVKRCYEKGLIMLTAGSFGNVIRHLVPLVVTDEQLEKGLKILDEAMAEQVE